MDKNRDFSTPPNHGDSAEKEGFVHNIDAAEYQELEDEWGGDDDHKDNKKEQEPVKEIVKEKVHHLQIATAGLDENNGPDSPEMSEMIRIEKEFSDHSESQLNRDDGH